MLKLKVVRRRSFIEKVERVLKLIVPPSESAPLSGVWPLTNSRASNIAPVMLCSSKLRLVPRVVIEAPSTVTLLRAGSIPRMLNRYARPSSVGLPATPGRRITTSPALIFGR